jgi:hypothetical protein
MFASNTKLEFGVRPIEGMGDGDGAAQGAIEGLSNTGGAAESPPPQDVPNKATSTKSGLLDFVVMLTSLNHHWAT